VVRLIRLLVLGGCIYYFLVRKSFCQSGLKGDFRVTCGLTLRSHTYSFFEALAAEVA